MPEKRFAYQLTTLRIKLEVSQSKSDGAKANIVASDFDSFRFYVFGAASCVRL